MVVPIACHQQTPKGVYGLITVLPIRETVGGGGYSDR